MKYEENPFQDPVVAQEWIGSVEGEKGMFRDKIIYPLLEKWSEGIGQGIVLEIGSGQGACAEHIKATSYVGVEPSIPLVKRAEELSGEKSDRRYIAGNAYDLPLANESVGAAFSVNLLFHLEDIERGSQEMARVLKKDGKFLIITANPEAYEIWESFYENPDQEGNKLVGKVNTPVVPLSKNVFYRHPIEDIRNALEKGGLNIESIESLTDPTEDSSMALFIKISGHK